MHTDPLFDILSFSGNNVLMLFGQGNSSITIYKHGTECHRPLNITLEYVAIQYRESHLVKSHWQLHKCLQMHSTSKFAISVYIPISQNDDCKIFVRIGKLLQILEGQGIVDIIPLMLQYIPFYNKSVTEQYNVFSLEDRISWHKAETLCNNVGGHLLSFHSQKQLDYIMETIITPSMSSTALYIGLITQVRIILNLLLLYTNKI